MNEQMQSDETKSHFNYTSVIKFSSWTVGAITALVCLVAFFVLNEQGDDGETARQIFPSRKRSPILGLLLMPVGGYMLGMAIAVLCAPKSFLLSNEGKKWMDMVGVKKVGSARMVSLVFSIIGIAILTIFTLAILTDDFKKPLF